jgi:two-component system, chemotaxis family, sensor kinase CheA
MSDTQTENRNDLLDSLLGDFLDESDQLLTQLNQNLLQLDEWVQSLGEDHAERCDENLLNEMFRSAHSLKGLSAMLGLTDINHLTHKIENVFDAARHDQLTVTRDVTELMFMGLDQLTAMVGLLKEPGGDPVDCDAVLEAIRRVLQTAGAEKKQTTQADAERALVSTAAENGEGPLANDDPLQGIEDEQDIPDNYLSMFVDEAEASLDALTSGLLAVEGGGSGCDLNRLLATAHKIKGSAASVGLNRAAKLAHLMEDIFERLVGAGESLTPPTSDVLLKSIDGLRQHVADLRSGGRESDHFGPLARDLLAAQPGEQTQAEQGPCRPEPSRGQPPSDRNAQTLAGRGAYRGKVTFQDGLPTAGLKAQLIHEKLVKLGEVSDCQPPPGQLDAIDHLDCFRFQVTTDQPVEVVANQLRVAGVLQVSLEEINTHSEERGNRPALPVPAETTPAVAKAQPPLAEAGQRAATTGPRPAETVRVDTERLDQLMDLAGQLVINRAQFTQIGTRLKTVVDCNQAVRALDKLSGELDKLGADGEIRIDGAHSTSELASMQAQIRRLRGDLEPIRREVQTLSQARDSVRELFEAIHQLERVSDAVQKSVMDIRMVPVGPLFARFQRVVRDISRASGKQVRLEIAGEKTELDKRMIDELGDPLVHLVRNSADHGIETPDQREAAGKPRQGTVTLDAYHRGNSIVIEVRDDGKGLDTDRILRKALEKELITEADAARMTTQQIQQLIWKPGLSTAEKVTDVSGRGMGMDIVKAKIEELSGAVEIASEKGKGTTIRIKLPLTLAILPSLMVDIDGEFFAVPMEAVTEIVSAGRDGVRTVQGRPMATVRGRVISLVRLGDLVTFHRGGAAQTKQTTGTTLVVVNDAGREIGLAVDRVIGEEDVVIKSIAENYRNVPGVAGASILGNGRVALILDVPALIASLSKRAALATC